MTVSAETEAAIRRLYFGEHWKQGTIATQLGVHVDVVKRVSEQGGALKLLTPSERVVELLTMTRLIELFVVFHDEEDAVASFTPAS